MKRKRRVLTILLAIPAVLVLLMVAGVLLIPRDRLVELALDRVRASTGREIEVGTKNVRLFPNVAVTLGDVSFGERAEPNKPRLAADEISFGLPLRPLLQRNVVLDGVRIVNPVVDIVLSETTDGAVPTPTAPEAEGAADVAIRQFDIVGGAVRVRRADGTLLASLGGLSEQLSATASRAGMISLTGTTTLDTLLVYLPAGRLGDGLSLTLQKTLSYDVATDVLELDEVTLSLAGVPIGVRGRVTEVRENPTADLRLEGGPAEVASLLGLVPSQLFPEIAGVESSGRLEVTGFLAGPLQTPGGPAFDLTLTLDDGELRYPGIADPIRSIALEAHATPTDIAIQSFRAEVATSRIAGHASIHDYRNDPAYTLAIDGDMALADLVAFNPALDSLALGGRTAAQIVVEGQGQDPDAAVISGTARAEDVSMRAAQLRVPVTAVTGDVVIDGRTVTTDGISARLGKSDVTVRGRIDDFLALDPRRTDAGRATATLDVTSALLDVDEFMPPRPEGDGGATERVPPAEPLLPELPRLDGRADVTIQRLHYDRADAENVRGTLNLSGNELTIDNATGDVFGGKIALGGTVDLAAREAPAFDVQTTVTGCSLRQVMAFNRGLDRFSGIAEHMDGTMSSTSRLQGRLDSGLQLDSPALSGLGDVEVTQATLQRYPIQEQLARYLGADAMRQLSGLDLLQPFRIEDGRLTFDGLSITGKSLSASGSGWTDITGKYALTLDLLLPRAMAAGVGSRLSPELSGLVLAGDDPTIMLPVTVSGSRGGNAEVTIDTGKLGEDARRRAAARLAEEKARLEAEAKARAEAAAAELLGRDTADTTRVETLVEDEVKGRVKDALDGLFGKKKKK